MKRIEIHGAAGRSTIAVGERLDHLIRYLPAGRKVILITDTNVSRLYGSRFPDLPTLIVGTGEGVKSLDTARGLYEDLIRLEADRSAFIVGIGGGIVCDLTGFVASTYLRGVDFGYAATTLLAQVDASVGGKNGVNVGGYKNMVGVFNQPAFVLCDTTLLATLPGAERSCGLAEMVKHAAIRDMGHFTYIENHCAEALALDPEVVETAVHDSVGIKAAVVNRDEREQGERRILNFGHTFGHAVEKITGCPHGEAVSVGMAMAADLSAAEGMLSGGEVRRLKDLLRRLRLPVSLPVDPARVVDGLKRDKKREGGAIHFVFLGGLGRAVVKEVEIDRLERFLLGYSG